VPPVTNATGRPSSLIGSMCTIIARLLCGEDTEIAV